MNKKHLYETALDLTTGQFVKLDWYDEESLYYHVTTQDNTGKFIHESDLDSFCL